MRRLVAAASILLVAMLLSACTASQAPGWTFAPVTPAPSSAASAEASAPASAAASAAPSDAASAAPSAEGSSAPSAEASAAPSQGGASGTVVDITALNVDWTPETKDLTAPANAAFKIHFDNQDPSTPHNIVIKDGQGQQFLSTELLNGPAAADYDVPALAAGTYQFVCSVHPNMVGTLTVQ
jgi:plastocyanin